MKETEWLECTDPRPMLHFLERRASDRKMLLFACACCRRVWRQLSVEGSRHAIGVLERYADGLVTVQRMIWGANAAGGGSSRPVGLAVFRVAAAARKSPAAAGFEAAWVAAAEIPSAAARGARRRGSHPDTAEDAERAAQCCLLRDLFGNPFQPALIEPEVLRWNEGTVPKLARAIYDERAFKRLPLLGDALEEAGCTADVVAHCRQADGHVLGCWVVDQLLGLT
jgi:hypothetical protein